MTAKKTTQKDTPVERTIAPVQPLKPGECKKGHEMRNTWCAYVPTEYTQDQLENPRLFAYMAAQLLDMDKIELLAEDGSWEAHGTIRKSVGRDVRIQIHTIIELMPPEYSTEVTMLGHSIRHGGATKKWYIKSIETGQELRDKLPTQMAAIQYLQDNLKAKKTNAA